jgi:hypothetical protein
LLSSLWYPRGGWSDGELTVLISTMKKLTAQLVTNQVHCSVIPIGALTVSKRPHLSALCLGLRQGGSLQNLA